MTKEKQNKVKEMILVILIFVGINYSIVIFFIGPKMESLAMDREAYLRGNESKSIFEALTIEKEGLVEEIDALEAFKTEFDSLIAQDVDTVQLTYDFYAYAKKEKIEGVDVSYQMTEMISYLEALQRTEVQNIGSDPNITALDAAGNEIIIEEIPSAMEEMNYMSVPISVNFELEKDQLNQVLKSLPIISKELIYPTEIMIEVEGADAAELGVSTVDTIHLQAKYLAYVDVNALQLRNETINIYDFYAEEKNNNTLQDLFESSNQNTETLFLGVEANRETTINEAVISD